MIGFPLLNTNHKMTFTHTSLGVKDIHFCLGSWSLISRMSTLGTQFWKHYTIKIFLEGGMWWKSVFRMLKNKIRKILFKSNLHILFILDVTCCCLLYNLILDGKHVHCWCKCNNVVVGSWISTRWNEV